MLFLQKLELRHSCRGGKQGARRVRRANREQKLWVQKIIKPVYLELRERRPKCRRQEGMVSPLQHPGMFINDARRHVGMIVILTAVRIRAALKQHMRVWQRFLFNAFVLWWFFFDKEEHPLPIAYKIKKMVSRLFHACLKRPEKIHGWKHNQTLEFLPDVSRSRRSPSSPWTALYKTSSIPRMECLLWSMVEILHPPSANIPLLAWLFQPSYTTGKNTSFGSFQNVHGLPNVS